MAFEKRLAELSARLLIADGTADGQLQIADAFLLKVKQTILLKSTTQATRQVQVKRVTGPTTFFVGRLDEDIEDRIDVSAFLVADGATVSQTDTAFLKRPKIAPEDFQRAVYDEEPTVALRSVIVDRGGRYIGSDPDSPFYVQLTDGSVNIGTVNAQLEMFITHKDNDPDAGDVHSSLRIGDGVDELAINPDGSINVNVTSGATAVNKSTYNEISAVPMLTATPLVTYTAPGGSFTSLQRISVSGDNIAKYKVKLNGTTIETVRTYFGGKLDATAEFTSPAGGLPLSPGDIVSVEVEHSRPFVGDFNGRIQVSEV
jgi:hypothetical protein